MDFAIVGTLAFEGCLARRLRVNMIRYWGGWAYVIFAVGAFGVCVLATLDPAMAMARPPRGAPGPLLGLGLPAAGVAVAVFLARRFRRKS